MKRTLDTAHGRRCSTNVRQEPGRFSTQAGHIASEKISTLEHGAAWLVAKTQRIGTQAAAWAEAVIQARGIEGVRVVQGLLSLAKRQPPVALEKACEIAVSYGSYRLRTIRTLLKRQAPAQASFEFMEQHPLIRSLADYAELVHASFQKEAVP